MESKQWIGLFVEVSCIGDLGIYKGFIEAVTDEHLKLGKVLRNGKPLCTSNDKVTLLPGDINTIQIVRDNEEIKKTSDATLNQDLPNKTQVDDSTKLDLKETDLDVSPIVQTLVEPERKKFEPVAQISIKELCSEPIYTMARNYSVSSQDSDDMKESNEGNISYDLNSSPTSNTESPRKGEKLYPYCKVKSKNKVRRKSRKLTSGPGTSSEIIRANSTFNTDVDNLLVSLAESTSGGHRCASTSYCLMNSDINDFLNSEILLSNNIVFHEDDDKKDKKKLMRNARYCEQMALRNDLKAKGLTDEEIMEQVRETFPKVYTNNISDCNEEHPSFGDISFTPHLSLDMPFPKNPVSAQSQQKAGGAPLILTYVPSNELLNYSREENLLKILGITDDNSQPIKLYKAGATSTQRLFGAMLKTGDELGPQKDSDYNQKLTSESTKSNTSNSDLNSQANKTKKYSKSRNGKRKKKTSNAA